MILQLTGAYLFTILAAPITPTQGIVAIGTLTAPTEVNL